MDETDLIIFLQSHLSSTLSVPIRTNALDDERPVPVIIIDDWDTNDFNFHNSAFAGEAVGDFNDDGTLDYEKYLAFDWRTRVEFNVRHQDEVEVSRLKENLKHQLRLIRENPQQFDDSLKQCRLGADGNPTNQFTEPKEAELMASARFHGDHIVTLTPSDDTSGDGDTQEDTLEQVKKNFMFNP
jgi:hypothetical protein